MHLLHANKKPQNITTKTKNFLMATKQLQQQPQQAASGSGSKSKKLLLGICASLMAHALFGVHPMFSRYLQHSSGRPLPRWPYYPCAISLH